MSQRMKDMWAGIKAESGGRAPPKSKAPYSKGTPKRAPRPKPYEREEEPEEEEDEHAEAREFLEWKKSRAAPKKKQSFFD